MPIKYIGRTTDFKGKTLWEIVGNLKNFGVGRIVARNMFERYPEPSFMKILKVETVPNEEVRKVKVLVEKTFRGRTYPKPVQIYSASYKADYKLIPKNEEESYCKKTTSIPEKTVPAYIDFPPVLKELIIRDKLAKGEVLANDPKLYLKYRKSSANNIRVAEETETPNLLSEFHKPILEKLHKRMDV